MAKDFELPELGEGIESAEVVGVRVSSGDEVEAGQAVIEVESDKATVEVPAPAAGRVEEVLVAEGDTVRVGAPFLRLASADDEAKDADEDEEDAPQEGEQGAGDDGGDGAGEEADDGDGTDEAEGADGSAEDEARPAARGRKGVDQAEEGGGASEGTEEDEAPRKRGRTRRSESGGGGSREDEEEREAEAGGADGEQGEDDVEQPRSPAARGVDEARAGSRVAHDPAPRARRDGAEVPRNGSVVPPAAPSVRRFAREIGVDVARVAGSGPGGRVSIGDVKAHARGARELRAEQVGAGLSPEAEAPDEERLEWRPMSGVRRAVARRMRTSWTTTPHVTLHAVADTTLLQRALDRRREREDDEAARVGLTAVLVRVLALALRAHPEANARIDEAGERIGRRDFVHLGVAVDTERGLLVPVLRDADEASAAELADELRRLAERARAGRLKPDEMSGGSATLTNLGSLGIERFTPLLVPGQAVVLGVGRVRTSVAWVDGHPEPRLELPLSLSFDHRVLDGADAARLVQWIVRALEDPWSLLLEAPSGR